MPQKRIHWPSPLSAWWIAILLGLGVAPLNLPRVIRLFSLPLGNRLDAWAVTWSFTIYPLCLLLAAISFVVQLVRLALLAIRRLRHSE